jgi:hypothetical protein
MARAYYPIVLRRLRFSHIGHAEQPLPVAILHAGRKGRIWYGFPAFSSIATLQQRLIVRAVPEQLYGSFTPMTSL